MLIVDSVRVYQPTTFQMPLMVLLNTRHNVIIVESFPQIWRLGGML